jgi:SagB-type dehydrogenase family enzyme
MYRNGTSLTVNDRRETRDLLEIGLENLDRTHGYRRRWADPPEWYLTPGPNREFLGAPQVPLAHAAAGAERLHALRQILDRRASIRNFNGQSISVTELSGLLDVCVKARGTRPVPTRRPYPSGGALYPVELYLLAQNMSGLAQGVFHYNATTHSLDVVSQQSVALRDYFFDPPAARSGGRSMLDSAAVAIILTSWVRRSYGKYRERAWKLALLEAGHIAQNLYLGAAATDDLGICGLGGFLLEKLSGDLRLDGAMERVLYPLAMGRWTPGELAP